MSEQRVHVATPGDGAVSEERRHILLRMRVIGDELVRWPTAAWSDERASYAAAADGSARAA